MPRTALVLLLVLGMSTALVAEAPAAGSRPNAQFDGVTNLTQTTATFNARSDNGNEGFFEYVFSYCPTAECPNGRDRKPGFGGRTPTLSAGVSHRKGVIS